MKLLQTYSGKDDWAFWIKEGGTVWYLQSSFEEKDLAKSAGFSWHGRKEPDGKWSGKKVWFTGDRDKAAKMADYADPMSEWGKDLMKRKVELTTSLSGSRQSVSYAEIPHPEGLDFLPFQRAGICYMRERKNTLLGDSPGLGKTVEAIGLINCCHEIKKILVICPATIKENWRREMEKWFVRDMGRIQIAKPDSNLDAEIIITNYESVSKLNGKLVQIDFDLMIIDEAHFIKNQKTLRYMSIMGGVKKVKDKMDKRYDRLNYKRVLLLTGTPVCNRPSELWPLINICDPEHWNAKTFFYYHKRYCNASKGRYGYDFKGAADETKLGELQVKLRETILIRRLKEEVLTDLPPKMRQIIELEIDENDGDIKRVLQAEKEIEDRDNDSDAVIEKMAKVELAKASGNDDEYRAAISDLAGVSEVSFTETSRVRHDTAIAKLPYAIEFIKEQLESVDKIVIAAYHHDVIEGFAKAFPLESVSIYGEMTLDRRQQAIDRFQNDENCKIAFLSMVLGVGITLTAASHIYFVEEDWVPATITQTEDRLHRIGQKDCVNVYHLVLSGSMDVKMIKMVMEKQKIIEATLDKILELEPVVITKDRAVSNSLSRQKIAEEAELITEAEVEEIHEKLKALAAMDRDHARCINGIGFNKIDGYMGHSLAQTMFLSKKQAIIGRRLVKKYAGQLSRLETVETW